MSKKIKYTSGDIIGKCIYLRDYENIRHGSMYFRRAVFECPLCGSEFICVINRVKSMITKSCGCGKYLGGNKKHGLTCTNEYRIWAAILGRCRNKGQKYYSDKGVKVCERWNDFTNFLKDMGPRPSLNHSVDRYPNPDGDYEPSNCRWATRVEQNNNRRNNINIEYNGETKTAKEWADSLNVKYGTFLKRYYGGWDINEMFNTPVRISKRIYRKKISNKSDTLCQHHY